MLRLVTRQFKRQAMTNRGALYWAWHMASPVRTLRASRHTSAFADIGSTVAALEKEGIVQGDASKFLTPDGLRYFEAVKGELLAKAASYESPEPSQQVGSGGGVSQKNYLVQLLPRDETYPADSAIIRLATDPKLLEAVSGYLGLWPRLHQIFAWKNFPTDEPPKESQMWHRDPEDPLGELAAKETEKARDGKRVLDADMDRMFAPDMQRVCVGPAGTMILADTVGFHRGGKPRSKNRVLVTFTYTSAWPSVRPIKIMGAPTWQPNDMQRMAL
jgi:hypothetical protein